VSSAATPPALPQSTAPAVRACCPRCQKPLPVCYCAHLHELPTLTRVVLLQHPREERTKVGTARMTHLSLPNSVLRVGLEFADDAVVQAELADGRPTYMLFPAPGAVDLRDLRGGPAPRLIVLDGTWRQARRLLRLNPWLRQLPAVSFTPTHPSEYQIRRQPAAHCVSTIEAVAEALRLLEPEGLPVEHLLEPFRAMVAQQQWYGTQVGQGRWRRPRQASPRKPPFADLIRDYRRIVCVQGEANTWARQEPQRREPTIVHWVAHRPASGETYAAIVAPVGPLAPLTPRHIGLGVDQLLGGMPPEAWRQSWQLFLRPDDLLVHWGRFYTDIARRNGLQLPPDSVDLRLLAVREVRRRCGTVEDLRQRLDPDHALPGLGLPGRAGLRLAMLVAVIQALAGQAAGERS
jgi:DTW domain-containing protein